jgi:probable O-glycosylation ligase (exosortase A-associated)
MRDLGLLLGCLVLLPLALRHAHVGVALWAWSGFLAPADRLWGFMAQVPLNKMFAAATVIALLVRRDGRRPYLDLTMGLMLALVPHALLSAATAISERPEVWQMFDKLVKVVVLGFVVTWVVRTRLRLHTLLIGICLGLALSGVWEGLAFVASGGSHRVQGLSTLGDNNQFALAMLMILPLLLHLFRQSVGWPVRMGLLGTFVLTTLSVVAAFSRGGFIGLVVLGGCLIATGRRKLLHLALLGGLAAGLGAVAPEAWFERVNTIGAAGEDASFLERVGAWKMSLLVAFDHPFLGGGFHSVQDPEVWASYLPAARASDLLTTEPVEDQAHASHDVYLEVLSDLGFPGLALFLGLMVSGLRNGQVIKRLAAGRPELVWAADLALSLQMSIIVYAISGAALSMAYFELFYLLLACLSALRRMVGVEAAGDDQHLAGQQAEVERPHQQVPAQ